MLRSSHDACGCSTQTTSTINLKRSTLHPHEGQADRPNTPSDSVNLGSNPGPERIRAARGGKRLVAGRETGHVCNNVALTESGVQGALPRHCTSLCRFNASHIFY